MSKIDIIMPPGTTPDEADRITAAVQEKLVAGLDGNSAALPLPDAKKPVAAAVESGKGQSTAYYVGQILERDREIHRLRDVLLEIVTHTFPADSAWFARVEKLRSLALEGMK